MIKGQFTTIRGDLQPSRNNLKRAETLDLTNYLMMFSRVKNSFPRVIYTGNAETSFRRDFSFRFSCFRVSAISSDFLRFLPEFLPGFLTIFPTFLSRFYGPTLGFPLSLSADLPLSRPLSFSFRQFSLCTLTLFMP